jgi:hypothetical protein
MLVMEASNTLVDLRMLVSLHPCVLRPLTVVSRGPVI